MVKYFKQGCVVYCIILYCVDGNHTCTCIITYDESGLWDAVGAVGGRGGEWSQHFHQSLMIMCQFTNSKYDDPFSGLHQSTVTLMITGKRQTALKYSPQGGQSMRVGTLQYEANKTE